MASKNSSSSTTSVARLVVKGEVPDREIPDNIDEDLYTDPEHERERVSFTFDPNGELADLLRENGHDVPRS